MLPNFPSILLDQEIASIIHAKPGGGIELYPNLMRIGLRRHIEVIFKLVSCPVETHINPGVDTNIFHRGKCPNFRKPAQGIVTHQFTFSGNSSSPLIPASRLEFKKRKERLCRGSCVGPSRTSWGMK